MAENESNAPANPTGSEARLTMHNRFTERLQRERGAEAPAPVETPEPEAVEAREEAPDAGQVEAEAGEELQANLAETDTETADSDTSQATDEAADSEHPEQTVDYWRAEAEKAEGLRASMQSDYQRKTAKLAERNREFDARGEELSAIAEFYGNLGVQELQLFEQRVDMAGTPEEHRAAKTAWQQAKQRADALNQRTADIKAAVAQRRDEQKAFEANVSKDVLRAHPDFAQSGRINNDHLNALAQHATEQLGYSMDEFRDITDYRVMLGINASYKLATASQAVTQLREERKPAPVKAQKQAPRPTAMRDDKGRFSTADQAVWAADGRGARIRARQARLRGERGR